MQKLTVNVPSKTYPIFIGKDEIFTHLQQQLIDVNQVVVIVDETVYNLHYARLQLYLPETVHILVVPSGEKSKDLNHYAQLSQALITRHIDRQAIVLAFGGGMIGDLAGFVAATYLRGVRFIQIPTTLLAHDSCVGGKVAINHGGIKNSLGAFYQPEAVYYHVDFLITLPKEHWQSGLAEVIKHGYLSPELLEKVNEMKNLPQLATNVEKFLAQAMTVKIQYVQADEKESGIRSYLNLGHTFGHAIETFYQYSLPHGIAVMYGLCFVHELKPLSTSPYDYLERFEFPMIRLERNDFKQLYHFMQNDKKAIASGVRFVVSDEVYPFTLKHYSYEQLQAAYEQFLQHIEDKGWKTC